MMMREEPEPEQEDSTEEDDEEEQMRDDEVDDDVVCYCLAGCRAPSEKNEHAQQPAEEVDIGHVFFFRCFSVTCFRCFFFFCCSSRPVRPGRTSGVTLVSLSFSNINLSPSPPPAPPISSLPCFSLFFSCCALSIFVCSPPHSVSSCDWSCCFDGSNEWSHTCVALLSQPKSSPCPPPLRSSLFLSFLLLFLLSVLHMIQPRPVVARVILTDRSSGVTHVSLSFPTTNPSPPSPPPPASSAAGSSSSALSSSSLHPHPFLHLPRPRLPPFQVRIMMMMF